MKIQCKKNTLMAAILSCALLWTGCSNMLGTADSQMNSAASIETATVEADETVAQEGSGAVPEAPTEPTTVPTIAPTAKPTTESTVELSSEAISQEFVGELTTKTVIPNESNVKTLGRTEWVDDTLWMVLPGTGAEFTFVGTKLELTLLADDSTYMGDVASQARIAIYVNGECTIDDMVDNLEGTYQVFESEEVQQCTVKVVKLSEATYSSVGIKSMNVTCIGDIKPTEPKEHMIEFIGDSITCGFGVDDDMKDNPFSTATENVTKTYAYKTAEALNADYSMVAYSGYGVISGYTGTEEKETTQLLPGIYDRLGLTNVTYLGRNAIDVEWDFTKRQPDLIVINLGSNDDSYTLDDSERQQEFADGYAEFLKEVRGYNSNATILCTLGTMGDRLFSSIEGAVADYQAETGDWNIYTMKFDVRSEADGYAAGSHPTEVTHEKAANQLTAKIQEIMGW